MNKIEQVTKVIAELEGCSVDCSHCQKIARKAIEAMLEPTEEMRGPGLIYSNDDELRYKAAISQALKE